jgi:hypothetical protein
LSDPSTPRSADLTPPASLDHVDVDLYDCPDVPGTDLFPPHRLTIE